MYSMSCLFHANRHLNNNKLHIGTSSSWVTASAGETLIENGQTDASIIFLPSMADEHNHGHRKTLPFSCCCVTWSGSSRRLNWHELRSLQRRPSHPKTVSQSVSQASLLWRRLVVQLVVQLRHPARLAHNLSTSSGFSLCSPSVLIKKQSAAGDQHSGPCCARCCRKRFTTLNSLWFGEGLKVNIVRFPLEALS